MMLPRFTVPEGDCLIPELVDDVSDTPSFSQKPFPLVLEEAEDGSWRQINKQDFVQELAERELDEDRMGEEFTQPDAVSVLIDDFSQVLDLREAIWVEKERLRYEKIVGKINPRLRSRKKETG